MRQNPTNLLAITILGALDGTIVILSARGALNSVAGALTVGLTVIGGAGAWITARQTFGGTRIRNHWRVLAIMALTTSLATVGAAWVGQQFQEISLLILPRVAGLVLLLISLEVGGLSLPRIRKIPLPVALVSIGAITEALLQWRLG
jgi:hypothetical protein